MAAVVVSVAEKLKDLLQAGQDAEAFSTDITPVRGYDTTEVLQDLDTLHCDVVIAATTPELRSRVGLDYLCEVDVAIRKKFGVADADADTGRVPNTSIDPLVLLLEEIVEYVAAKSRRGLASTPPAAWKSAVIPVPFHPEHLQEHRQFTGVVRVTYEAQKTAS